MRSKKSWKREAICRRVANRHLRLNTPAGRDSIGAIAMMFVCLEVDIINHIAEEVSAKR